MKICVSLSDFIDYTVGVIYYLAPNHKPRFIYETVDKIIERFKVNCLTVGKDFFYHEIELKDLYKFIKDILMPIETFRALNLSQNEYEKGISVDDKGRPEFCFISRYSWVSKDDDFVDLDACIQNIFTRFEQSAFREWLYGEIDIKKLCEFRRMYKEVEE